VVERRRRGGGRQREEEGRGAFEAAAAQQHGREGRRSEGEIPHLNQLSVGRGRCRLAWVTRREERVKENPHLNQLSVGLQISLGHEKRESKKNRKKIHARWDSNPQSPD
jgi:hypothetical protein